MPEPFPFFVGFPIKAVIEEVEGVEVVTIAAERRFVERLCGRVVNSEAVAARIADWVRREAGDIAVGGQWAVGAVAGDGWHVQFIGRRRTDVRQNRKA